MNLRNNASVAHAVVQLASAFDDVPGHGRTAASVLSRIPGDGAPRLVQDVASALGLETVVLRAPHIECHPSAIDMACTEIEVAVETGKPILVLVDEAHGAAPGILSAIASFVTSRSKEQPCLILAISTSSGEGRVAEQIADGLGVDTDDVAMHRTAEENLRLVRRVIRAMP